ncbi:hypothetical protein FRC02_004875 [Tulasnella sp. 418]|nr:hypothetical protein FRC02_004875 [Tulasnella sp. 418]
MRCKWIVTSLGIPQYANIGADIINARPDLSGIRSMYVFLTSKCPLLSRTTFDAVQWKSLALSGITPIDYLYIRPHSGGTTPVTNVTSPDLRCNVGGSSTRAAATLTAQAGNLVVWTPSSLITKPGVWTIYLARVPDDLTAPTFDGSGQVWFKIAQGAFRIRGPILIPLDAEEPSPLVTPSLAPKPTVTLTPVPVLASISATIPKELPTADYLVRAEFIDLTDAAVRGGAKFFVACGQISVYSKGSGIPRPLVAIPDVYTAETPGILYNVSGSTPYMYPGPTIWPSWIAIPL